jgi:hemoglobin-like flavoprotein
MALTNRGVHAVEYGIFGDSLLFALRDCLQDEYTAYTESCWIKVDMQMTRFHFWYNIVLDNQLYPVGDSSRRSRRR